MSHQPQRKAKDCLNCGTIVHGRYCHTCGQENIVTHQNFTGLARHFIYDIFHFDGKFFDTLKNLLFKPGIVAKEYVKGRRASYLDPIRMYLFTSAVFFLLFFSLAKPDVQPTSLSEPYLTNAQRADIAQRLGKKKNLNVPDTMLLNDLTALLDTSKPLKQSEISSIPPKRAIDIDGIDKYKSINEYDSLQKTLPADKRDGWIEQKLVKKGISFNTKYGDNVEEGNRQFWDNFLHQMPYVLFISLPFFALILKLLYIRRKNFFYSDHAVFTLYHYIFSFFILLFMFAFDWAGDVTDWASFFNWLMAGLAIAWFVYLYKSMRHFYGQSRFKTIGKFFLLNFLGFTVMIFLFVIFIVFSIFQL